MRMADQCQSEASWFGWETVLGVEWKDGNQVCFVLVDTLRGIVERWKLGLVLKVHDAVRHGNGAVVLVDEKLETILTLHLRNGSGTVLYHRDGTPPFWVVLWMAEVEEFAQCNLSDDCYASGFL
jgi:hypothetical protein